MKLNKGDMVLAGIDLAWGEKNPSAIAQGCLSNGVLRVIAIDKLVVGIDAVFEKLRPDLRGIAIDAPLIIENQKGQRACEKETGVAYGSKGASCHTSNASLFPNAQSVRFSKRLRKNEFYHLDGSKWQIECYPHPAIIEIFGLQQRLKYKKGSAGEKKEGQKELASYIRKLKTSVRLKFVVQDSFSEVLAEEYIAGLKGRDLKANEDALDSLICLYIAGLYAADPYKGRTFGDKNNGYIWIPFGSCI